MEKDELIEKVNNLATSIDKILNTLRKNNEIRENTDKIINNNFTLLNEKIDNLTKRVSSLHQDTNQNFGEVKFELVKIQNATNYEDLYANSNLLARKADDKPN